MTNKQFTYLRAGVSAAITVLVVLYPMHPSWTWISAVVAAAATLGIHAIPSIGQTNTGVTVMSEQPQETQPMGTPVYQQPQMGGNVLMGVTPAYPTPEPTPVETAPEPAPTQATPEPVETAPEPVTQPQPEQALEALATPEDGAQQRTAPVDLPGLSLADRLRALADEVEQKLG